MNTGEGAPAPAAAPSALAPFRHAPFAVLWSATVLSNTGTWMHELGAGWLMTTLTDSALFVALVQTATTLPVFLFALPAGALADILDRRRMLLAVQSAMIVVASAMAALILAGAMSPLLLLVFTFLMGTGNALTQPTWQAIVPRLVPREHLPPAIALNSAGINISRAIGPAAAGFLIAGLGLSAPFWINAASFAVVVAALLWWRPGGPAHASTLPSERFFAAIRTGLRYVRASPPMRATLMRALGFFIFASAYWAMLPLIARSQLGGGAGLYGLLLGAVGAGAIVGAMVLPRLRQALGADRLVAAGALGTALALVLLALVRDPNIAIGACLLAGGSWIAVLSSLHVSAQMSLPDWVRARGLSVFVTVLFGAMSVGSVLWGRLADAASVPVALLVAAGGGVLAVALTWRWKLQEGVALDLAPSMHWPTPMVSDEVGPDRGPVMVTVEYRIDPAEAGAFVDAAHALARERRRDGAFMWGLFEDAAEPGRYVEAFLVESWLEHLRQHERVTRADAELQARVKAFHVGPGEPVVHHLIAPAPQDALPRRGGSHS